MRIIVVGAGEVGTYIADRLSRQEHDIALIELLYESDYFATLYK